MEIRNKAWTDEEFFKVRKDVLAQYRTGKEIEDIDECVAYQKNIPGYKRHSVRCHKYADSGEVDLHVMIGVATLEQMIDHMKSLEDLDPGWGLHPDTYTRSRQFEKVQSAVERSKKEGRSVLNGFPIINYGVKATRAITESCNSSISFNTSDKDTRLQAEMVMAGGFTGIVSHSLHDLAQHHRDAPLDEKIWTSQYNAKLAAYYTKRGAPITCNQPGNFSGWDMPGFRVADDILEGLLTIEQGVKESNLGLCITLNLIQDVAAFRVLKKLAREYFDKAGHKDVKIILVSSGWLGDFPVNPQRALGLLSWQVVVPVLAGVPYIALKSVDEALSIPTKEGNRASLMLGYQLAQVMGQQRMPESDELKLEEMMLEKEVRATVDKVLEIGQGDVAVGMVKAVDQGVLDTMLSPYRMLKGKVLWVRDNTGAMRYMEYGNIPLPKDVVKYHHDKIAEREKKEGKTADWEMVQESVTRVTREFAVAKR
jgi:methylaspartate mutase epsilon subunit